MVNSLSVQKDCTGEVRSRIDRREIVYRWTVGDMYKELLELTDWQLIKTLEFINNEIKNYEDILTKTKDIATRSLYSEHLEKLRNTFSDYTD